MGGESEGVAQRLRALIGDMSLRRFAEKVGVNEATIRGILKGKRPYLDTIATIASAAGVDFAWLATGEGSPDGGAGDLVRVPVLNVRASAGHGCWNERDEVRELLPMTAQMLRSMGCQPEAARIIEAHGDSMEPTIMHGDLLVVDTAQRDPHLGGIYVFRSGDHLQVKRVKVNPQDGSLTIGSDNPAYGPFQPDDPDRLDILGRVVWVWRRAR